MPPQRLKPVSKSSPTCASRSTEQRLHHVAHCYYAGAVHKTRRLRRVAGPSLGKGVCDGAVEITQELKSEVISSRVVCMLTQGSAVGGVHDYLLKSGVL